MSRSRCLLYSSMMCLALVATPVSADVVTHFTAQLDSSGIIRQGVVGSPSTATGVGTFTLTQPTGNPGGTTMSYSVQFTGVDLDGNQTPSLFDDVTAIHFHDVRHCMPQMSCIPGDTVNTHHLLNVYGAPSADDDDLVVSAATSTISGIWDDGDATMGAMPSMPVSDPQSLEALFGGHVYLMIHTNEAPNGAIGGQLVIVPEPMTTLIVMPLCAIALLRSRRRTS